MAEVVGYKEILAQRRASAAAEVLAQRRASAAANEVSVDTMFLAQIQDECARRIVKHMWIIFVLLPVVLGILFALLTSK
jgi:hypothetical protein